VFMERHSFSRDVYSIRFTSGILLNVSTDSDGDSTVSHQRHPRVVR